METGQPLADTGQLQTDAEQLQAGAGECGTADPNAARRGAAQVDLNADLGEGAGCDAQIMAYVTSANIACGGHAGDEASMRASVALARENGVRVGAHPGYADRANFGRVELGLSADEVYRLVFSQVSALKAICDEEGVPLVHVKPHGALYNRAARDEECAEAIARAVADVDPGLALVGLAGSSLTQAGARAGLAVLGEFFADRGYMPNGTLVPRTRPDALIHDADEALARTLTAVRDGVVTAVDGTPVPVRADTVCLHGDNPEALDFARRLSAALGLRR